jgi:hypothetical protein
VREYDPLTGFYVLDGHTPRPARSIEEWMAFASDIPARTVALDKIGAFTLSTVFTGVGIDLENHPGPGPLVFETGFFAETQRSMCCRLLKRYASWEEAERGHAKVLTILQVLEAGGHLRSWAERGGLIQ